MKKIILTTSKTFCYICQFDVFKHQYLPSTFNLGKRFYLIRGNYFEITRFHFIQFQMLLF